MPLGAIWISYTVGMLLYLPLSLWALARRLVDNVALVARTRRRRIDLLGGKLSLFFLNGFACDVTSLLFGERFVCMLYGGLMIDPGSSKMRAALARHLRRLPRGAVRRIAATHHHEEHAGNLTWLAQRTRASIHVGAATRDLLTHARSLPLVRRLIMGELPPLEAPVEVLGDRLSTEHGELEVVPTPGHCDDHVAFYDAEEKLLFAGDAFMGASFSTPNCDVDNRRWIRTIQRMLELDIEVLIEGHGRIHTLRRDIPDVAGLVVRKHPREALREKLEFLKWMRAQVESGFEEGLPVRAIRMKCFPWRRRSSWEQFLSDELSRVLSFGHWSRTELVRSFSRRHTVEGAAWNPLMNGPAIIADDREATARICALSERPD